MKRLLFTIIILLCILAATVPAASAFTAALVNPSDPATELHNGDSVSVQIDGLAPGDSFTYHIYSTDLVPTANSFTLAGFNMPFGFTPGSSTIVMMSSGVNSPSLTVTRLSDHQSVDITGASTIISHNTLRKGAYDISMSGTPSGTSIGLDFAATGDVADPVTNPSALAFTIDGVNSGHLTIEVLDGGSSRLLETLTITPEPGTPLAGAGGTGPSGVPGPGDAGGGGGGGAGAPRAGPPQGAVEPVVIQLAPLEQPGTTGMVTESFPMGFVGFTYNADGSRTLTINLDAADSNGAVVTIYPDHVVIYQHHSPGVTTTFWGDHFSTTNRVLTGTVTRAEFVTDPLNATLDLGDVSGSVHAALPALLWPVVIDNTISGTAEPADTLLFQDTLIRNNLVLRSTAFIFKVQKGNLTTGPGDITLTVPSSWVDQNGGKDAVRITRISEETGQPELLATTYLGTDPSGNMIFRGDSPGGTSLFGLVTAGATAAEQKANPEMTIEPATKPAMGTNVGMVGWLTDTLQKNPVLILIAVAILALVAYFGYWQRRL
jgi:hypothetical protein